MNGTGIETRRSQTGFFSVYIQVAKMKTALTWLHISLTNSSDYCIQAKPCLACTFVCVQIWGQCFQGHAEILSHHRWTQI